MPTNNVAIMTSDRIREKKRFMLLCTPFAPDRRSRNKNFRAYPGSWIYIVIITCSPCDCKHAAMGILHICYDAGRGEMFLRKGRERKDNPVFASIAKHGVILRFSVPSPKLLSGLSVFRVLRDRKDYTPFSPTPAWQALPVAGLHRTLDPPPCQPL